MRKSNLTDEERLERKRASAKKWRDNNPDKVNASRTKEQRSRGNKKWYDSHPEYYIQYREKNRERIRAYDNERNRKIREKENEVEV